MKCNNPNVTKCPGEIEGPYSECNQCGWRTQLDAPTQAPARTIAPKVEVATPNVENK